MNAWLLPGSFVYVGPSYAKEFKDENQLPKSSRNIWATKGTGSTLGLSVDTSVVQSKEKLREYVVAEVSVINSRIVPSRSLCSSLAMRLQYHRSNKAL